MSPTFNLKSLVFLCSSEVFFLLGETVVMDSLVLPRGGVFTREV